jgi:diguanylate cyclase (GGDEF)-like protein
MEAVMPSELSTLTALTRELQDRLALELMLQRIVDHAARLLDTPRVSVRLLDPTRTRLVASARAGSPLHQNAGAEFKLGEGLVGWIAEHIEPMRLDDAESDPRFQPRADQRVKLGAFLGVPLVSGRACIGVLSSVHPERGHFSEHHLELLSLIAGVCAPHVEVARLQRLSQVDPLTGALNRRGLDQAFPEPVAEEVLQPHSVAMADVDRFKAVNDAYGHAIGDEVLKHVAHVLAAAVRVGDAVIRYGGEEFLLVLPKVDLATAWNIAERARSAVETSGVVAGGVAIRVTISIGVAARRGAETREQLIKRADEALYAAKDAGRNRIETAEG